MEIPKFDLSIFPSQLGNEFKSENPLEEVWEHVKRLTHLDYVMARMKPSKSEVDWNRLSEYGCIRLGQAVEFWKASQSLSLITGPLPLYYSFLNLMRGFLALKEENFPSKAHGLLFKVNEDIFQCAAEIKSGTFSDFLKASKIDAEGKSLTLFDCLARIIEIADDFIHFYQTNWGVFPIKADVTFSGKLELSTSFPPEESVRFWANHSNWFPTLKDRFSVVDGKFIGQLTEMEKKDIHNVSGKLLGDYLEGDLTSKQGNLWYLIQPPLNFKQHPFPRSAYYFIAMFILGSIVRYQPELLKTILLTKTSQAWLLERFIKKAGRYYPQLMLMWGYGEKIFF